MYHITEDDGNVRFGDVGDEIDEHRQGVNRC